MGCPQNNQGTTTTESGLTYEIVREGRGPEANKGQVVKIHESTSYLDGTMLFNSKNMEPIRFKIGAEQVIQGVEEGVQGMKVGEIRKMIIPPSLGRRSMYPDLLSPDSTLLYIVEMIEIEGLNK